VILTEKKNREKKSDLNVLFAVMKKCQEKWLSFSPTLRRKDK